MCICWCGPEIFLRVLYKNITLAVLNVHEYLLSDVFGDKGLINRFKHSIFGVDIRHKCN